MGDRCYLRVTIHGHIEKAEHLTAIIKALGADGLCRDHTGQGDEDDFLDEFADALVRGDNAVFSDSECNYANIDTTEDVLDKHGVAWSVDHDAGGGYPAGMRSCIPGGGRYETIAADGEPCILAGEIAKAMLEDKPLEAVARLVEEATKASATYAGMPVFSVGEEVKAILAVRIAKQALGVAA